MVELNPASLASQPESTSFEPLARLRQRKSPSADDTCLGTRQRPGASGIMVLGASLMVPKTRRVGSVLLGCAVETTEIERWPARAWGVLHSVQAARLGSPDAEPLKSSSICFLTDSGVQQHYFGLPDWEGEWERTMALPTTLNRLRASRHSQPASGVLLSSFSGWPPGKSLLCSDQAPAPRWPVRGRHTSAAPTRPGLHLSIRSSYLLRRYGRGN
jgi:hypothetical protein